MQSADFFFLGKCSFETYGVDGFVGETWGTDAKWIIRLSFSYVRNLLLGCICTGPESQTWPPRL